MILHAIFLVLLSFPVAHAAPLPAPAVVSEAQIATAQAAQNLCESSSQMRTHYDCTCIGAQSLETLRRMRLEQLSFTQENAIQKRCPNMTDVAGNMFTRCMSWGVLNKKTQESFCECYANRYALSFARNATDNNTQREEMMTAALNACNISTAIIRP